MIDLYVVLLSLVVLLGAASSVHAAEPEVAAHPRLLLTEAAMSGIRKRAESSPAVARLVDAQLDEAERLRAEPVSRYEKTGRRLLGVSREVMARTATLAFAYRWTGEQRYADRAAEEMLAAAAFPDWNPSHFLDVGEMTTALAFGYDWLHDVLPEPQRRAIREAIVEKGLRVGRRGIDQGAGWSKTDTNWAQVCLGGLAIGALAVWEHEPELAAGLVDDAVGTLPRTSMAAYGPDGAYPEGTGYWSYGTSYNLLLIEALRSALGTDRRLSEVDGFARSAAFIAAMTGPSGQTFDYMDSGSRVPATPLAWFAARAGDDRFAPVLGPAMQEHLDRRPARSRFAVPLLTWYRPRLEARDEPLPRSWMARGKTPVVSHRSAWDDSEATWIAAKGGQAAMSHGHVDVGTFVFEAAGVRWAVEAGREGYHGIESLGMNLWATAPEGDRWRIFRLGHRGHSIPLIDGRRPDVHGKGEIIKFDGEGDAPTAVIDLSPAYRGQVERITREVGLRDGRQDGIVRDRLSGVAADGEYTWNMLTRAECESVSDDGQTLVLEQDGRRLTLEAEAPSDARFEVVDVSEPANEWDSPNPGMKKVVLRLPVRSGEDVEVGVTLKPR